MVSKFNIYTVHLKCFDSIRYHLNQYKTLTKHFNQGLNSGELAWKMAKSKHQQGTNVAHNVRGGLLIDLTIVAIALLLRYTLSMSLKLTDITQWNVGAVVLEQF